MITCLRGLEDNNIWYKFYNECFRNIISLVTLLALLMSSSQDLLLANSISPTLYGFINQKLNQIIEKHMCKCCILKDSECILIVSILMCFFKRTQVFKNICEQMAQNVFNYDEFLSNFRVASSFSYYSFHCCSVTFYNDVNGGLSRKFLDSRFANLSKNTLWITSLKCVCSMDN